MTISGFRSPVNSTGVQRPDLAGYQSFVAEAADRVEVGSFHGGINPKKQADAEGNQQAHQGPEHRDAGGQRGNKVGHAKAMDEAPLTTRPARRRIRLPRRPWNQNPRLEGSSKPCVN